ncbi:relaxase/mobilization nuclease domain-containing protein [Bradyrhizobium sp. 61]|uniref:relaxase/mobilization nuclease domain-containing protein n=1 Tax=Bradyrhizobium sp. 61 TaxID=2782679 RepID=UPI001FFAF820|nr:relaxase/mobilization nuclease domain-containing protein [Bradyrhizobium sp. 61]MCK1281770.1 relaxase/mobilization nuclease domain-containing protein [Bradyrhizobium sp. 61]
MIPRLQARGKSFKGSCRYVLHDPKAETRDRVAWMMTQNLTSEPEHAWFEMHETCQNQAKLKANAGLSARGRKNTTPVLHYTLSWHADDAPTPEQMKAAAIASLKQLGLEGHEALIVGHHDKKHPHLHIVANTVHPYTGRTAALKFTKERLSEWALEYEQEIGRVHCNERLRNAEERKRVRCLRKEERLAQEFAPAAGKPYVPIKDLSPKRREWLEKKAEKDRRWELRKEVAKSNKLARDVTWERQQRERDALDDVSQAKHDAIRARMREEARPKWRQLYRDQAKEMRFVTERASHPFERAVFVFRNRERLGGGKPLTFRQMFRHIVSTNSLAKTLGRIHERERQSLARDGKTKTRALTDNIWQKHKTEFSALKEWQTAEREQQRAQHDAAIDKIMEGKAKTAADLKPSALPEPVKDRPVGDLEPHFNDAAWRSLIIAEPEWSRAEQVKRDMEAWRRTHSGQDFGREL